MERPLRIAVVVHGYPPELRGGTECTVQSLCRGLAGAGHAPFVIAGTDRFQAGFRLSREADHDPGSGRDFPVWRIHRDDGHYGHWAKGPEPRVGDAFERCLVEARADVVHVHHWTRLTSDLVVRAARRGVPAVVTLHDLASTCLIYFRVRPDTRAFCSAPLAPEPCLDCARGLFPSTPWLSRAEEAERLERRRRDLWRELGAARAVLALCADQARVLTEFLGFEAALRVLPPASATGLAPSEALASPRALGVLRLGCWSTLHPLKGTDLLVAAVRELVARGVPLELHLAGIEGDAPFVAALRAEAAGLPVRFHGPFESLEGHPATRVHAFVAGTRARETWGVVLDEAIALRLPMVLPAFGAYGERLREGEGALFYDTGDARSLARALERLWREPELHAGLRGRLPPSATLLPSLETHVQALERIYADAVRAGAPAVPPEDAAERAADEAFLARWARESGAAR